MGKFNYYLETLDDIKDMENLEIFLLKNSGLPDSKINLDLVRGVIDKCDESISYKDKTYKPTKCKKEFMAVSGVIGLGKLLSKGNYEVLKTLKAYASDSRATVRDAVAFALQNFGREHFEILIKEMNIWKSGNFYEQEVILEALCEPNLLNQGTEIILEIITYITEHIQFGLNKGFEGFETLINVLSSVWKVVVFAFPDEGKKAMEKLFSSDDSAIGEIVMETLRQPRLRKKDYEWVKNSIIRLNLN